MTRRLRIPSHVGTRTRLWASGYGVRPFAVDKVRYYTRRAYAGRFFPNTRLHAVTDAKGGPIGFFLSAGQVSDYTGAATLLGSLPKAGWLLTDRGHDADRFREALKDKGIKA